ncbi:hypothetical protein, partial [Salmonella sp. s54412]|uniref:hypothetical protein n=1 Tax=Salmonella sp. s54412 TaxID=3160128 RepID=UPI00375521EA
KGGNKRKSDDDNNNSSAKKAKPDEESQEQHSVFIGNISFDAGEEDVKALLEENNVAPSSVRIMMADGRSRGFGYADFPSEKDAKKALGLTGIELCG